MAALHWIGTHLDALLAQYGYLAVFLVVIAESAGIPAPGETMLIAAAAYAGATHRLDPVLVIATAALAGIAGDNVGFAVGRFGGYPLLERYGRYVRLDRATLKIGRYLYDRYGGRVVFAGRFIPILRIWGAVLAGANRLPWRRFVAFNAAGAIAWATAWGTAAAFLGDTARAAQGAIALVAIVVATLLSVGAGILLARDRERLARTAESRYPG